MSALVLELSQQSWWERFQRGLERPDDGAALLWERWTRSRELGAPNDEIPAELGLERGVALRARQERLDPLLSEVRDTFDEGAAALAAYDFTLLLADAEGVVVRAGGGGAFAPVAQSVRLIEGASWGEAARGTNAIGTALAEGRPTAVVGAAHYARPFHELVCYAAPVRDPEGRVVAALDATSMVSQAHPAVWALVSATAQAMEATWRARAWARASAQVVGLVERTLDRVAEPALLVQRGQIVRCNAAARVALGARRAPVDAVEALGLTWDTLRRAALSGGVVLPKLGALGPGQARLEPLFGPDGALLSIAVFREGPAPRLFSPPQAPKPPELSDAFRAVFAEDPATRAAVDLGRRVAPSVLPIVLLAETGSGKERFAEALHAASKRRDGPFVAVNCGSFAPELLAAELFGYGPGAFTGADRQGRDGLLHAAAGGTLFLDEIGEMPPAMQVALLRVLEDGRFQRVGERTTRQADVRVICATCRDLPALVATGAFRQDLWYRLKGVVLRLPPLRAREDRLGLARFLLAQATRPNPPPALSPALEALILRHPWPGNVRELKSALEVALVLAEGAPILELEHLPPDLTQALHAPDELGLLSGDALDVVQANAIRRALEACAGNVSAAARRLGVARSTIYRALQRRE
ncbi:MAG: sigma-54-dependent Fis family transcriptional regulator [Deltaproteobacteria bacterium]|nr:sigma-54-dependent Fis family transcriptional regulator [Deltaproteobacteria bacterium]